MGGAIAVFDPVAFVARYPEFATVGTSLLSLYFNEATLYLANDGSGPVSDAGQQLTLLNMLVAHLASIYSGTNGQPASPLVGRISQATEGSVSVSTDLPELPGSAAWYAQTKYGLQFWAATAPYRTMQYRPRMRYGFGFGPGYPGYGNPYGNC